MIRKNKTILKAITITFVIILLLKLSLVFLWPFLFAFMIVIIMEPTNKFFISKGIKRNISVILTLGIYFIIICIFGAYIWNYIAEKFLYLTSTIPKIINSYHEYEFLNIINENYEKIIFEIKNIAMEYKEKIFKTIINTFSGLVYFFLIILSAIFISMDIEYLSNILKKFIGDKVFIPLKKSIISINKLISIELKLIAITSIITTISFFILGFNDSLSIGIICGILDLLPLVGPLIIFIPIIIYLLISKSYFIALGLIFTYILTVIVRQIFEIRLLQNNLVIKPIFVIFSLYCGFIFFGTVGVLFGPLILIMFKEIYKGLEKGDLG